MPDHALHWLAVHTQHRFEMKCAVQLTGKGYSTFVPTYWATRKWSDRIKVVEEPLFPGYIFCRLNPLLRLPVLTTPRILGIVGAAGQPIPIPDSEIASIQKVCDSGLNRQPWPFLKDGDEVYIQEGPLSGLSGLLLATKSDSKVVVSVNLLHRSIAVVVDRLWVRPGLDRQGKGHSIKSSNAA